MPPIPGHYWNRSNTSQSSDTSFAGVYFLAGGGGEVLVFFGGDWVLGREGWRAYLGFFLCVYVLFGLYFFLNTLHLNSSHPTYYTEKKGLRNIQTQFPQNNLRKSRNPI